MIGVIGESLIDLVEREPDVFVSHRGGCALNTAVALSRLGCGVGFFCQFSDDFFGREIVDSLAEDLIFFDPDMCNAPYPTMAAFVKLRDGNASYSFHAENTAAMTITKEQLEAAIEEQDDLSAVHMGSVSLAVEPAATVIYDAFMKYHERFVTFIDPNIRMSLVKDKEKYFERLKGMFSLCDIIKISDEDVQCMYPDGNGVDEILSISRNGFIMTCGSEGSVYYRKNGDRISVPSLKMDLVDTIGCGDTFGAAILCYLENHDLMSHEAAAGLSDDDIREMLEFATKAAGINCTRSGCNPPTLDEVNSLEA